MHMRLHVIERKNMTQTEEEEKETNTSNRTYDAKYLWISCGHDYVHNFIFGQLICNLRIFLLIVVLYSLEAGCIRRAWNNRNDVNSSVLTGNELKSHGLQCSNRTMLQMNSCALCFSFIFIIFFSSFLSHFIWHLMSVIWKKKDV